MYKYFGIYSGPSYGGYDRDYMMAFRSIREAKAAFTEFQSGSLDYDEFYCNPDGFYVPWRVGQYSATPGTSDQDYMDLYAAEKVGDGQYLVSEDVDIRIALGPRGGVVVER